MKTYKNLGANSVEKVTYLVH